MRSVTSMGRSVGPRLWLELGDRHRPVGQRGRAGLRVTAGKRVLQPLRVVALREVLAGVAAAAFLARERRRDGDLGVVDEESELECLTQVGVVAASLVVDQKVA